MTREMCRKCGKQIHPWERRDYIYTYPVGRADLKMSYKLRGEHYPTCEAPEEVKLGQRLCPGNREKK